MTQLEILELAYEGLLQRISDEREKDLLHHDCNANVRIWEMQQQMQDIMRMMLDIHPNPCK